METLKDVNFFILICFCDFILASESQNLLIKRDNLNRRLLSWTFLELTVKSHHDCARACFNFGGKCKSINFNKNTKRCELNAKEKQSVDDSDFESNVQYIFSDITEWPKLMTSGCSHENCLESQQCRPGGNSFFQCVTKETCGEAPPIDHGSVSAPVTLDGSQATYSCDIGYENKGKFTKRTCVKGSWSSETITCTIKDCGALADIPHATLTSPMSTTHGSTVTYSCQYGYERISGDLTRHCFDGLWDGVEPVCLIKDCDRLRTIIHGDISISDTVNGSTAVYTCYPDYQITSGNSIRTCVDGLWTGSKAVCKAIPNVGCFINQQSHNYHGTKQHTIGGLLCQRWDSQHPHKHNHSDHEFPENSLTNAHNYCRDPNMKSVPWCYTTNAFVIFGFCGVPRC